MFGNTAVLLVFTAFLKIISSLNASCPSIRAPKNGFMVSNDRSACGKDVGSVCRMACPRNYVLRGDNQRVCQSNGMWSGRQGTCVDPSIRCLPQLIAPTNGFIDGECVNWGGFVCNFACNDGYIISGSSTVTCDRQSRRWTNPTPTCVRDDPVVTCPQLDPPEHGIQSGDCDGTNSLVGSRCRFSCDSGYELQGSRSLVCQPNGSWNGFVPICTAIVVTCRTLRAPENGYNTGDCGNNPSQSSRCYFHCNSGYELQGRSVLTCTSDGNWNGNVPSCVRRVTSCRRLSTPENGAMRCNQGMTVGSRCVFSCNSGYEIEGQRMLTCLENGSWNGVEPTCESSIPTCPALDEPRSGSKEGSCSEGAAVGSVCRFTCNTGFQLRGSPRLVCQVDGNWDNQVPECVRQTVLCPALVAPANGARQGACATTAPVGSVCTFSCNSGFTLRGQQSLVCLPNGQWNSTAPTCVQNQVNCPALSAPTNGARQGACVSTAPVGSVCTFSCNSGFTLRGQQSLVCLPNGQWNSTAPTCVQNQVICPALSAPINGAFSGMCGTQSTSGAQCMFSCNSGYTLEGSSVLVCQANGNWNSLPPRCTLQQREPTCPALDAPENGSKGGACFEGVRVGASCAFRCNDGYTLTGKETLVCQVDGTWDDEVPECVEEPQNCPSLSNPIGGTATGDCSPGVDNRLCAFSCNRGYYLIGTPILLCKDGNWSARTPTCRRSSRGVCGLPVVPNGAIITFCNTLVGGRCYFACRYSSLRNRAVDNLRRPSSLSRDVFSVCQPNGRWRGRLISCRPGISSVSWILGFPFG